VAADNREILMPNRKVALVIDSTTNLPGEILQQYPITVIPLTLIWGDKTYSDSIDIQPDEFYRRLKTSSNLPTTSQVTPAQFGAVFARLIDQGFDILCITIAATLSGTMDSAIQAKAMYPKAKIELVDSQTTSLAMGFQVLAAARAAAKGASLEECKALAEKARSNSSVFFCLDTLEFLYRGGRIGGASRFLGTALNLKPILELRGGQIIPVERVRTQSKAHNRLLELVGERISGQSNVRLAIIDADAPEEAKIVLEKAKQHFQTVEILRSDVSPVIGVYAGPGTVGIAYMVGI
jgi:DegV family protein with EDD domain